MTSIHPYYRYSTQGYVSPGINTFGVPGPLVGIPVAAQQMVYPDGSHEMPYAEMMRQAGGPQASRIPGPSYPIEHQIIPDHFYSDGQLENSVVFFEKLTQKDLVPITKMLPYKLHEHSLEEQWDEWEFRPVSFDITPEEAPYRLTEFRKASYSVRLQRRCRGFSVEKTSQKLAGGREERMYKLEQLTQGLAETNSQEALTNCLNAVPMRGDTYNTKYNQHLSKAEYDKQLKDECQRFCLPHKDPGGIAILMDHAKATLANRHETSGKRITWMAMGLKKYVQHRPENTQYWISGRKGVVGGEGSDAGYDTIEGEVYESRPFVTEGDRSVDPMFETVAAGNFFYMSDETTQGVPWKEYQTYMRDVRIYSEDLDDWYTIPFKMAIRSCGLFEYSVRDEARNHKWDASLPLTHIGQRYFQGYSSWEHLLRETNCYESFVAKVQDDQELLKKVKTLLQGGREGSVALEAPRSAPAPAPIVQRSVAKAPEFDINVADVTGSLANLDLDTATENHVPEILAKYLRLSDEEKRAFVKNTLQEQGYTESIHQMLVLQAALDSAQQDQVLHNTLKVSVGVTSQEPSFYGFDRVGVQKMDLSVGGSIDAEATQKVANLAYNAVVKQAILTNDRNAVNPRALANSKEPLDRFWLRILNGWKADGTGLGLQAYVTRLDPAGVEGTARQLFPPVDSNAVSAAFKPPSRLTSDPEFEKLVSRVEKSVPTLEASCKFQKHFYDENRATILHVLDNIYRKKGTDGKDFTTAAVTWYMVMAVAYETQLPGDPPVFADAMRNSADPRSDACLYPQQVLPSNGQAWRMRVPEIMRSARAWVGDMARRVGVTNGDQLGAGEPTLEYLLANTAVKDGRLMQLIIDFHLPCPLGFLGIRNAQYEVGHIIHMVGYGRAGYTYLAFPSLAISQDNIKQTEYVAAHIYTKATVKNPDAIVVVRNAYAPRHSYKTGTNGHTFYEYDDHDAAAYRNHRMSSGKSIILMAVPSNWQPDTFWLDSTGKCNPNIVMPTQGEKHYPTADIYSQYWGFHHGPLRGHSQNSLLNCSSVHFNTVYFQDYQAYYVHAERQWKVHKISKGVWGSNVYPGCSNDRFGGSMYLKPVNYKETATMMLTVA